MKHISKKNILILMALIVITGFSLKQILTQERFDPSTVQSKECQPGEMKCGFNPDPIDKVESVPLAESTMIAHRGLPSRVDLSSEMPPVVNQGRQNSCVAFSTGYYTKSYYEYKENRWRYDTPIYGGEGEHVFSPAYIYNQINGGQDRGSYFHDALNLVVKKGAAPWKYMPYNENDYLTQPSGTAHQIAQKFRAKSFKRIPFDNINAIKSELANGNPIIFGMVIDDNFYQLGSDGNYVFDNPGGKKYGGHAMTLVGYDDNIRSPMGYKGAFKLVNSWGTNWGDKGYAWISYKTWLQLRPYVYVLYDEKGNQIQNDPQATVETTVTESTYIPAPGNISATKGTYPDKVVITWNPVSQAIAYAILRLAPGGSDFEILGYSYSNSYEDRAVSPNVSYKYAVISLSEEKTSDPEQAVIVTGYASSQNIVDIPKVYNVQVVYKDNKIYLSWEKVPGIQYYQIRRWDEKNQEWLTWNKSIYNTSFVDYQPLKDQVNRYSVRAGLNNQYGEWSEPVEVNVPGNTTPPPTPTIIDVSQGLYRDKIIVKWENVPGAEYYVLFRYDYNSKMWEGPFRSNKNIYRDQDPKIMNGDYFAYTVVALNSAGKSDYSNVVVGNTNPNVHRAGEVLPPPKNLKIEMKDKKVILTWDPVKGSDEYYIYRKKKDEKEYKFIKSVNQTKYEEDFPGKEGDLFFYTVRSKPALGKESENAKPVVAFINPEIQMVTHRFMPGQGMERFEGTWKGSYWDGSSEIENYVMNINGQNDTMVVTIERKGKKEIYKAKYPALSEVVRFPEFELQYKPDFELLILEGKNKSFKGKVITFTK
ncbi:MAG: cysteine protease [Leptospiraceae bacterium]|nr:MAG: cysteine protease [Leptospiraceae bacterium]